MKLSTMATAAALGAGGLGTTAAIYPYYSDEIKPVEVLSESVSSTLFADTKAGQGNLYVHTDANGGISELVFTSSQPMTRNNTVQCGDDYGQSDFGATPTHVAQCKNTETLIGLVQDAFLKANYTEVNFGEIDYDVTVTSGVANIYIKDGSEVPVQSLNVRYDGGEHGDNRLVLGDI